MSFPYLTRDTFCLTLAHSIDDIDLVERFLGEYSRDTEECIVSALRHALESSDLPPMPPSSSRSLLAYLTTLWRQDKNMNWKFLDAAREKLTYLLPYFLTRGVNIHYHNDHALFLATQTNNIIAVKMLLDRNADVHNNILTQNTGNANLEVIKLLMEHGADPHADTDSALYYAVSTGNDEVVKFLLDMGLNVNGKKYNLLSIASSAGRTSLVKLLLDYHADINLFGEEALVSAVNNDHLNIAKLLLENGAAPWSDRALKEAIDDGNTDAVKLLLQYNADIHVDDDEPLVMAIKHDNEDIVKILLEHKANVHAQRNRPLHIINRAHVTQEMRKLVRSYA